jgi:hypothetical protein
MGELRARDQRGGILEPERLAGDPGSGVLEPGESAFVAAALCWQHAEPKALFGGADGSPERRGVVIEFALGENARNSGEANDELTWRATAKLVDALAVAAERGVEIATVEREIADAGRIRCIGDREKTQVLDERLRKCQAELFDASLLYRETRQKLDRLSFFARTVHQPVQYRVASDEGADWIDGCVSSLSK